MSMPSDVNPDVAEAVEAIEKRVPPEVRRASKSLFRKITPEQYGFAAATLVAFLGVAIFGPKVQEMRKPRRKRLVDRARETARDTARETRERARDVRDEAARRLHQLGGGTFRR